MTDELVEAEATGFDALQWGVVKELTETLCKGPLESGRASGKADVRTLLNAAWTIRLASPADRALLNKVTKNVEILWKSSSDPKGRPGGSK